MSAQYFLFVKFAEAAEIISRVFTATAYKFLMSYDPNTSCAVRVSGRIYTIPLVPVNAGLTNVS